MADHKDAALEIDRQDGTVSEAEQDAAMQRVAEQEAAKQEDAKQRGAPRTLGEAMASRLSLDNLLPTHAKSPLEPEAEAVVAGAAEDIADVEACDEPVCDDAAAGDLASEVGASDEQILVEHGAEAEASVQAEDGLEGEASGEAIAVADEAEIVGELIEEFVEALSEPPSDAVSADDASMADEFVIQPEPSLVEAGYALSASELAMNDTPVEVIVVLPSHSAEAPDEVSDARTGSEPEPRTEAEEVAEPQQVTEAEEETAPAMEMVEETTLSEAEEASAAEDGAEPDTTEEPAAGDIDAAEDLVAAEAEVVAEVVAEVAAEEVEAETAEVARDESLLGDEMRQSLEVATAGALQESLEESPAAPPQAMQEDTPETPVQAATPETLASEEQLADVSGAASPDPANIAIPLEVWSSAPSMEAPASKVEAEASEEPEIGEFETEAAQSAESEAEGLEAAAPIDAFEAKDIEQLGVAPDADACNHPGQEPSQNMAQNDEVEQAGEPAENNAIAADQQSDPGADVTEDAPTLAEDADPADGEEASVETSEPAFEAALQAITAGAAPEPGAEGSAWASTEEFRSSAYSLWSFAKDRRVGEAQVRFTRLDAVGDDGEARSALEVVNDDMPFLLESLSTLVGSLGYEIRAVLHPMPMVARDDQGAMLGVGAANDPESSRESWIQLQFDQVSDAEAGTAVEKAAADVLRDVRAIHRDRETIVERMRDCAGHLREAAPDAQQEAGWEAAAFLDWLADDHFTLLACRDYSLSAGGEHGHAVTPGRGLGLMRDPEFTVFRSGVEGRGDWTPEMAAYVAEPEPLTVLKADRRSPVRRPAHLDLICVKRFDGAGKVVGQTVFVGLFAASAYSRSPTNIPLLRRKVRRVIARSGFAEGGHDAVALANILDIHPRDELFQAGEEELRAQALGALQLKIQPRTRLFARVDRFGRFMSCLVYVSRERFDSVLRVEISRILCEAVGGRMAVFTPFYGDDGQIRIHFVIALDKLRDELADQPEAGERILDLKRFDMAAIERRIVEAARDWSASLRETLDRRVGAGRSAALLQAYGHGFPASYRETATPAEAAADLERLEALSEAAPIGVAFSRRPEDAVKTLRVKLYRYGDPAPLSDAIPILENMGLRILEERPSVISRQPSAQADAAGDRFAEKLFLHDFLTEIEDLEAFAEDPGAIDQRRGTLEEGFIAIWRGEVEDDRLNRLMLGAGLSARQIALLRAYSRFLRQARISYSVEYMEEALIENPRVAEALSRLFEAQFRIDPARDDVQRELESERLETEIEELLEGVARLDVDRILRRMRNAVRATLRTNFFQPGADGRPKNYFSFKLLSGALEELPAPRPWREIFVYSPSVEGCHLRGGPVARGGLRWSDRREDFRTEVLGLVKAQQVKNAVIVPVGSKGGFLPKKLPVGGSREEIQAEAIESYKTFLRGMLDITDNLVDGEIAPPENVARRDEDDPYLVVAADKGTATFSDIANGVAGEYGFWLGDAFASGGGEGYDHKAMGITARGAWEAVKRHFRELGKDIQSEPFTAVGVGDMSGDVFGNGMLLSKQTRLLAAFDHRDVFIDPNPDAAASYAERERLFQKPRSSWQDYDKGLISKGGGVFSRSAKSIPLTDEIREMLGVDAASVTPFELIQSILGAKSDLLWFGGIGTYVKADAEGHEAAGDRANDQIRVDASELGAKVVGEGANLGVTQAGRIALATRGVKINTDAVDNAAGVDCSDHEVNIKIGLGAAMASGKLTEKDRSELLREMTDEVSSLVLASNYDQTGALSALEARAPALLNEHRRFIRAEEAAGRLNRAVEGLPNDEALTERERDGRGLTRPELAVLIAYAKNGLQAALIDSNLPDDPYLEGWLLNYFPSAMRERFREEIFGHRLRREIVATLLAGAFVNESGPGLALRLQEETGAAPGEAVRAYLIARELFGLGALGDQIDALDNKISAQTQIEMRLVVSDALANLSLSLLQGGELGDVQPMLDRFGKGVEEVAVGLESMLSDFSSELRSEKEAKLVEAGAPASLAARLSSLPFLGGAVEVVSTAEELGRSVSQTAATYFAAGSRFRLEWLRIRGRAIEPRDDWERIAIGRLIADLRSQQTAIAASALRVSPADCSGADAVEAWAYSHESLVGRADRVFSELRQDGALSVAKLAVASSQLRGWE